MADSTLNGLSAISLPVQTTDELAIGRSTNRLTKITVANFFAKIPTLTNNGIVTTSGSDGTLSVTATTGSGNVVLSTSPTLTTPNLGTPSAITLTNGAGLPGSALTGAYTAAGLTMATARLLGRSTASTGAAEEITVGTGLSLSGGTLTATGSGSGDVTGPVSSTDNAIARWDGTGGDTLQNSGVTIDDSNNVSGIATLNATTGQITGSINDTNDNELLKVTATASAVNEFTLANAATGNGPSFTATGGDTNIPVTFAGKGTGAVRLGQSTSTGIVLVADQPIVDSSSNEFIKFTKTASAVNEITVTNQATGANPSIAATGGDSNIALVLAGKGTGGVICQGVAVNAQTGTTYTLDATDNGKVVTCSNASAITVTVPSGLGQGYTCAVVQKGAGQITFSPSSTTVNNRQSHTKTAAQYAVVGLTAYVADTFVLSGDTAA